MWILECTRADLLTALSTGVPGVRECQDDVEIVTASRHSDLVLIWNRRPGSPAGLPDAVVVGRSGHRDFLAWAWTYLSSFRPITTFMRVLDAERISDFAPRLRSTASAAGSLAVGATLGEALTYLGEHGSLKTLTPLAGSASLSFCLARANDLAYGVRERALITQRWEQVRFIFGQARSEVSAQDLLEAWEMAFSESASSGSAVGIRSVLEQSSRGSQQPFNDVLQMVGIDTAGQGEISGLAGSREARLGVVERLLQAVSSAQPRQSASFIAGYLVSLVSGGTLGHAFLLDPYRRRLPTSLFWYGVCAAAYRDGTLLAEFDGLGMRLQREISRPFALFGRPTADLSFEELDMTLRGGVSLGSIPSFYPGVLHVELVAGVTTSVRQIRPQERAPSVSTLFPDTVHSEELRRVAEQVRGALESLERLAGVPKEREKGPRRSRS